MTRVKVTLDRAGVGAILRGPEVRRMVDGAAHRVAAGARVRGGEDVVVEAYTTDRGAAAVVVRDIDALGKEAKRGVLSGAAAAAGLTVRRR